MKSKDELLMEELRGMKYFSTIPESAPHLMGLLGLTIEDVKSYIKEHTSEEYIMKLAMSGYISWSDAEERLKSSEELWKNQKWQP